MEVSVSIKNQKIKQKIIKKSWISQKTQKIHEMY